MENYDESASHYYLLVSCRRAREICSGPLFRVNKEGLQSQLRVFVVPICSFGWDFQLNWNKQSSTRGNARWERTMGEWLSPYMTGFHSLDNTSRSFQTLAIFINSAFHRKTLEWSSSKNVSSPEQSFTLLKRNVILPSSSTLPNEINPDGLTAERKNYLYHEIRQFCKPETEDLVAPAPWTFNDIDSVACACK